MDSVEAVERSSSVCAPGHTAAPAIIPTNVLAFLVTIGALACARTTAAEPSCAAAGSKGHRRRRHVDTVEYPRPRENLCNVVSARPGHPPAFPPSAEVMQAEQRVQQLPRPVDGHSGEACIRQQQACQCARQREKGPPQPSAARTNGVERVGREGGAHGDEARVRVRGGDGGPRCPHREGGRDERLPEEDERVHPRVSCRQGGWDRQR